MGGRREEGRGSGAEGGGSYLFSIIRVVCVWMMDGTCRRAPRTVSSISGPNGSQGSACFLKVWLDFFSLKLKLIVIREKNVLGADGGGGVSEVLSAFAESQEKLIEVVGQGGAEWIGVEH